MRYLNLLTAFVILFLTTKVTTAQVKIGGNPGIPHASAILQLDDTTRGFLPSSLTTLQRNNIATPANGLIIYNNSSKRLNVYHQGSWHEIISDSAEWQYDPATAVVKFVRPYAWADTNYYHIAQRKFLFADKATYTNSQGINLDALGFQGKVTIKTTASKNADSIGAASNALVVINEIDNAAQNFNGGGFGGIYAVTTVNPLSLQKPIQVTGITNAALNAGQDTTFVLIGVDNTAYNAGVGYTETLYGILNRPRMGANSSGSIGTVFGIFNQAIRSSTATGRIQGNAYGYFGSSPTSFNNRVDGNVYGIFLSGIVGAVGGNYAIFTSQGRNRFGDSVLVSNSATVPRAFFDINNTTSMIIPTGPTINRNAVPVIGMMRFNTDNGGLLEMYNGGQWVGTLRTTIGIDLPLISAGTGTTISVTVNGATVGSSVSVSPTNALNDGLIISYARVSALNTVEIRFNLLYGAAINPSIENYYIRVFQ
jgi:hypothetical protein